MSFPFKKVLMLGATSGLGLALSRRMVDDGIKIVAVGRRQQLLDDFVRTVGPDRAAAFNFDITKLEKIPYFAAEVLSQHPDLDCVFVNAGINRPVSFIKPETVDMSAIDDEVTCNYLAPLHITKAFLPWMQKQDKATCIAYTTSGLALFPRLGCSNYCATKAALHHFILALREEMRRAEGNVRVVELYPPAVQTEINDNNAKANGMPLDDFADEAWSGLRAGKDQVSVGMVNEMGFTTWEQERQRWFQWLTERTA